MSLVVFSGLANRGAKAWGLFVPWAIRSFAPLKVCLLETSLITGGIKLFFVFVGGGEKLALS